MLTTLINVLGMLALAIWLTMIFLFVVVAWPFLVLASGATLWVLWTSQGTYPKVATKT